MNVAPVRERGLKLILMVMRVAVWLGRSREGAWIEIGISPEFVGSSLSRSREGAWIEIGIAGI